jgi:hypothetical protein
VVSVHYNIKKKKDDKDAPNWLGGKPKHSDLKHTVIGQKKSSDENVRASGSSVVGDACIVLGCILSWCYCIVVCCGVSYSILLYCVNTFYCTLQSSSWYLKSTSCICAKQTIKKIRCEAQRWISHCNSVDVRYGRFICHVNLLNRSTPKYGQTGNR